jgi:copper chaperone CopZ
MQSVMFQLPLMYGDHHVLEVRRFLLALPGVAEVNASSAFQSVEVYFDEETLDPARIESCLAEAGYRQEASLPVESGVAVNGRNGKGNFYRHTAAKEAAVSIMGFNQHVPAARNGLWPCPGFGPLSPEME